MTVGDCTIHQGDALTVLRTLPERSVHCCVTSPPYWGLRDYGTAKWEGGDADCDHAAPVASRASRPKGALGGGTATVDAGTVTRDCRCGARRIDDQLGLEPTPEQYVARLVDVFREVRRVLRDDGTLWLNLGDSYASSGGERLYGSSDNGTGRGPGARRFRHGNQDKNGGVLNRDGVGVVGLKPKDLIGIPWRVAFALQADGWWLRQDIIWHKPAPMPESVTDRCTKSHEYVFLLSKSARYYFDAGAIAEEAEPAPHAAGYVSGGDYAVGPMSRNGHSQREGDQSRVWAKSGTRNRRSVWTVATEPYPGAHFATYPTKLVEPCILAGCPKEGTVLDPFCGSGTTLQVAANLGRFGVGIELNPKYIALAERRIRDNTVTMDLFQ